MAGSNPYQRLKARFALVAVVVGGVASPVLQDWFVRQVEFTSDPSEWMDTIVGLVLIAVFLLLLTVASQLLFDVLFRIRWIRKTVLGKDWVEGIWIDAPTGSEESAGSDVPLGIISICYGDDGEIVVDGESLTGGKADYHFHSVKSDFHDKQLRFIYRVTGGQIKGTESHGFACYSFSGMKSRPDKYSGYFLDVERPARATVAARKLDSRQARILQGNDEAAARSILDEIRAGAAKPK